VARHSARRFRLGLVGCHRSYNSLIRLMAASRAVAAQPSGLEEQVLDSDERKLGQVVGSRDHIASAATLRSAQSVTRMSPGNRHEGSSTGTNEQDHRAATRALTCGNTPCPA